MTKKDFELIAAVIKISVDANDGRSRVLEGLVEDMADMLHRTHPRFDRGRFERACGVS